MKLGIVLIIVGILGLMGVDHYAPGMFWGGVINASEHKADFAVVNTLNGKIMLTPNGVSVITLIAWMVIGIGAIVLIGGAIDSAVHGRKVEAPGNHS